jgi:hypothetical protein
VSKAAFREASSAVSWEAFMEGREAISGLLFGSEAT